MDILFNYVVCVMLHKMFSKFQVFIYWFIVSEKYHINMGFDPIKYTVM